MIDHVTQLEDIISTSLGWPVWALRTLAILSSLLVLLTGLQVFVVPSPTDHGTKATIKIPPKFRSFQLQYLSVYLIIMLADWLQGTNMYTLYLSYGVNIGTLFLTGFLSSAVFGTFLGIYVDRWGRRLGCLLFCFLEVVINLLEHIPSMPLLLIGRILGGLSTSLLFSAFESWMVSEHRKRGFHEDLLTSTFSISSWGNGLMAVTAGICAQVSADVAGDIGPFQLAILLTLICGVLIIFWPENYGQTDATGVTTILSSFNESAAIIYKSPVILLLGLAQAVFEGAMYTFVFMWVPTLMALSPGQLPTGLVFSCFMLSLTMGGMLFGIVLPFFPGDAEALCATVYLVAAAAMCVPFLRMDFWPVFVAFLVLEAMVGMFFSCAGTLRSRYYPEQQQSSIMSVFRLPLNALVVIGTKLSDSAKDKQGLQAVFGVVVGMLVLAFVLQSILLMLPKATVGVSVASCKKDAKKKKDVKKAR